MKYIMLQHKKNKHKIPIIFPATLIHAHVSDAFLNDNSALRVMILKDYEVVSAGDCTITCVSVSGSSETLGLVFGDGDSEVIDLYDYRHGF